MQQLVQAQQLANTGSVCCLVFIIIIIIIIIIQLNVCLVFHISAMILTVKQ